MCMCIEYHLYFVYFLYYVNDYNLFIIFVFLFMGSSMSAIILSPNDHEYYNVTCCIIRYVEYLYKQYCCRNFLYESCVSIKFISSYYYFFFYARSSSPIY